jgi:hypothetical protein
MMANPPLACAVLAIILSTGSAVTNAQLLPLPARSVGALSGSAFGASISALPRADREEAIAREVLAGNVPEFLRVMVPVRVSGLVQGSPKSLTIHVLPD